MPEPYSAFWGHLKLMGQIKKTLPSDANTAYLQVRIVLDWKKYFPGATSCPPLVYVDFWPFVAQPMILLVSPEGCAQLTQDTPQPRHELFHYSLSPLTKGLDMISMDMSSHAKWRQKLLPAFSARNIESHVDAIVDRVEIFVEKLRAKAKTGGSGWGEVFPLYEMTVSLTFDIIVSIAM